MPVVWRVRLGDQPRLIQSLHYLIWERPLLEICQVGLELTEAAYANQDAVAASVIHLQNRMVAHPSQGRFDQREAILLSDRLDHAESLKVGISEIPVAIVVSGTALVAVSSLGGNILGLVLSREQPTGQRVVDNDVKTIPPADGNKFSFDIAGYGSVSRGRGRAE